MHIALSSLLTTVWENRDAILYSANPSRHKLGDYIYDLCTGLGPQLSSTTTIEGLAYSDQIKKIEHYMSKKGWSSSNQFDKRTRVFVHFHSPFANLRTLPATRIYINAKPEHAFEVMQSLVDMLTLSQNLSESSTLITTRPNVHTNSGYLQKIPNYTDIVLAIKIADVSEALRGRTDLIVIYVTSNEDVEALARYFAEILSPNMLLNDVTPMTRLVAPGISFGAQPTEEQISVAGTFTQLRCALIARALYYSTKNNPVERPENVLAPLPPPRVKFSPDRAEFIREVQRLFTKYGISMDQPWN